MRPIKFVGLFFALCAETANAGWLTTPWGSSPAALIGAMQKTFPAKIAANTSNDPSKKFLVGLFASGAIKFNASYEFYEDRLVSVHLAPVDGNCSAVMNALKARYRSPFSADTNMPATTVWHDRGNDNAVTFQQFSPSLCFLDYAKLPEMAPDKL